MAGPARPKVAWLQGTYSRVRHDCPSQEEGKFPSAAPGPWQLWGYCQYTIEKKASGKPKTQRSKGTLPVERRDPQSGFGEEATTQATGLQSFCGSLC